MQPDANSLVCPLCGQVHEGRVLKRGQRAVCIRCRTTLAERGWLGTGATLAFALSGLFLSLPAVVLPFVTLEQFGRARTTHLLVGFDGFWSHGFSSLGAWVLFCGTLAPFALLVLLVAILTTDRRPAFATWNHGLRHAATTIENWAMPEVQVLGVMVAFFKLGAIVHVTVGPGLWCYGAAALCMLIAWRRFSLHQETNRAGLSLQEALS